MASAEMEKSRGKRFFRYSTVHLSGHQTGGGRQKKKKKRKKETRARSSFSFSVGESTSFLRAFLSGGKLVPRYGIEFLGP